MSLRARRLLRRSERSCAPTLVRRPAELAPLERVVHRGGRERTHEHRERDVRPVLRAVPVREGHIHRAVVRSGGSILEYQPDDGLGATGGLAQLKDGRAGVVNCVTNVSIRGEDGLGANQLLRRLDRCLQYRSY